MAVEMIQLCILSSSNISLTDNVQWRYYASLSGCTATNVRVVQGYALFGSMCDNAVDRRLVYDFNFSSVQYR